jgi:lipopolysaccharide export system permease protein
MLRIHDRYVLALFTKAFVFSTLAMVLIYVLVDLFEKIDEFIDNKASVRDIVRYYLYLIPEIVRLTLPVDVMLATIFTLGLMGRHNEVVAFLSSGISMLRLNAPILAMSLIAVGVSTILSERIVPETNERRIRVRRVDIQKREPHDARIRRGFVYRGEGNFHYYARTFNTQTNTMRDVTLFRYRDGRVVSDVRAEKAVWRLGYWEFENGVVRVFLPKPESGATEHVERFLRRRMSELRETPEDLARLKPEPDAMNYSELKQHVEQLRASGAEVNDYLVELHTKISYPLTNFIMAVLGIGLAARKRKSGMLAGFGITIAIAFLYLAMAESLSALGKNESISPLLAAWIGPVLFSVAGVGMFARVNR